MRRNVLIALLPLLAGGCISTVGKVVTAPVRIVSKGVDWTTTSQSEADRNYGKKMRKKEAAEGKAKRAADEAAWEEQELKEKQRQDRKKRERDD